MKLTCQEAPANPAGLFTVAPRWMIIRSCFRSSGGELSLKTSSFPMNPGISVKKFTIFLLMPWETHQ